MRDHIRSHPHPFFLSSVCGEVIYRDLHALPLLEFAERVHQKTEIEGVWMVKVVIVTGGQQLLFSRQNLQDRRENREGQGLQIKYLTALQPSG